MSGGEGLRDWRVGMIAGAAVLHLTAGALAWIIVPEGTQTRLDRPIEASFAPMPDAQDVVKEDQPLAQAVMAPDDPAAKDTSDAEEASPATVAKVEARTIDPPQAPPVAAASVAPVKAEVESVITGSTSAPAFVVPEAVAAMPVAKPEDTGAKDNKSEEAKPRKIKSPLKPDQQPAKPKNTKVALTQVKPAIRRAQQYGTGAASDVGTAERAQASGAALQSYGAVVLAKIRGLRKPYPPSAFDRDIEGTAQVGFTVLAQGGVAGVRLTHSSGDAALDNAAMSLIRGLSLPPPPNQRFQVKAVPISYTLHD